MKSNNDRKMDDDIIKAIFLCIHQTNNICLSYNNINLCHFNKHNIYYIISHNILRLKRKLDRPFHCVSSLSHIKQFVRLPIWLHVLILFLNNQQIYYLIMGHHIYSYMINLHQIHQFLLYNHNCLSPCHLGHPWLLLNVYNIVIFLFKICICPLHSLYFYGVSLMQFLVWTNYQLIMLL